MKHYKKLLSVTCLGYGLVSAGVALAATPEVSTDGGLQVGSPKDDYWFGISGGIKVDQTFFTGNANAKGSQFRSGGNIHSTWIDFDGGIGKDLTYSIDFRVGTDSKIKLDDAYFTYHGLGENVEFSVGQICPGFSLQSTTSSKWTPFLEKSLDSSAFNINSGLGANITKWDNRYSFTLTAIQPGKGVTPTDTAGNNLNRSDRWTVATRVTYNPFINLEEHKIFQIGGSLHYQDDSNAGITFHTYPEAKARNTGYALTTDGASNLAVGSTTLIGSKHHETYGVEMSGQNGPLYGEAEYQLVQVKRSTNLGNNLKFSGWHVQAAYVLTGEARTYKPCNGTFGQVVPQSESGAWEVAARYSTVNLNNKDIRGGVGKNITLGVNYYANRNVRVAANYINSHQKINTLNRKLNIFAARLQLVF